MVIIIFSRKPWRFASWSNSMGLSASSTHAAKSNSLTKLYAVYCRVE